MNRKRLLWLAAIVALAVLVAVQTATSTGQQMSAVEAGVPTVAPGVDVLAGI
ncbi:hypothetical protein ABQF26_40170, partial [Mycolicibacterium elephantis]